MIGGAHIVGDALERGLRQRQRGEACLNDAPLRLALRLRAKPQREAARDAGFVALQCHEKVRHAARVEVENALERRRHLVQQLELQRCGHVELAPLGHGSFFSDVGAGEGGGAGAQCVY